MRFPFADALAAEHRPGTKTATVVVRRGDVFTVAATTDWQLSAALVKAALDG